mgnify:CR=1 FL=1
MAEVAIPILALGAMYLINNDGNRRKKSNEGFDNVSAPNQRRLISGDAKTYQATTPDINYPKPDNSGLAKNVKYYKKPNAAVDKYFKTNSWENNTTERDTKGNVSFKSLTGNTVKPTDLKHNNMQPFFGSRVKQRTSNFHGNESILDNRNGSGSQNFQKKARAPLFAPQKNMHFAHGAPNTTDFIKSRMNPSRNISNTKPWEEIRVGPGLNKGFSNEGSNGFNAGMEARDKWRPKNVDELRTKTNPKVTFGLANLEGPAQGNFTRGIIGKVEKSTPDTFYLNSPDRWFTTTGAEKAQTVRSAQTFRPVNRPSTTQEYYGASNGNQDGASLAGKAEQNYRKSRRPVLAPFDKYKGPAHNMSYKAGGDATKDDYGKDGFNVLPNSRTTTRQADEFGIAGGWLKAITAPVMDMLRPSRKENVIGNMRPNGNAGGNYGVNEARVWNPADRTKTTIKEQTIENKYGAQPYQKREGGFEVTGHSAPSTQRESTSCPYIGNGAATGLSTAAPVYNAAYNAHLNPNKEVLVEEAAAKQRIGNMSLFNSNQNIAISKIGNVKPDNIIPNMPKQTANMSTYGSISGNNMRSNSENYARNDGNLLTAFNNNPYTKSLSSVA